MGLSIRDIIPRKEIKISELKGKIVCVDAFNTLYQFLSTIRQQDGTPLMDDREKITSHLSGLLYRNSSLLAEGIKLVYVFDGEAPALKAKTHKKRKGARDIARERYEEAKLEADIEKMKRYGSQLLRLDDEMIRESKELLEAMGIPVLQAPSEGEAEAAYLANKKEVYAAVSQDYDSLLFGAPILVRNLTLARRKKTYTGYIEVNPELIELDKVLKELEINLDQMICLGILVGSDYNPKGVPGIGQKRALDIVRKFETPEKIFEEVKEKIDDLPEEDQFEWKVIFDLFKNHEVKDFDIKFGKIDEEKIREILVKRHNFSEERVQKQIDKLNKSKKKSSQKGLDNWM